MPDRPTPSQHAKFRWLQYAGPGADIELAWETALELSETGLHGDEARYCPENDVILVRKDSHLTTVIDNAEDIRPEARTAIEIAREKASDERADLR